MLLYTPLPFCHKLLAEGTRQLASEVYILVINKLGVGNEDFPTHISFLSAILLLLHYHHLTLELLCLLIMSRHMSLECGGLTKVFVAELALMCSFLEVHGLVVDLQMGD